MAAFLHGLLLIQIVGFGAEISRDCFVRHTCPSGMRLSRTPKPFLAVPENRMFVDKLDLKQDCHAVPQVYYVFQDGNPKAAPICRHVLKLGDTELHHRSWWLAGIISVLYRLFRCCAGWVPFLELLSAESEQPHHPKPQALQALKKQPRGTPYT